jgi:hypothetical protein
MLIPVMHTQIKRSIIPENIMTLRKTKYVNKMRISTPQVSSVMLRSKELEIRNKKKVKTERAVG